MSRPFIVIGDKTDHGGQVIEGSPTTDAAGKVIARVGDKVTCPKRGHGGTTTIVTGDPTCIIDGKAAARHGDKTACGATLLSSQAVTTTGGDGGSASPATQPTTQPGQQSGGFLSKLVAESHHYDIHFVVRDELTGRSLPNVNYKITLDDGKSIVGVTDANGLTEKIGSNTKQKATLEVHHNGNDSDSGAYPAGGYGTCRC
jgi:uncharacterized Zn-binding protein involved in type VI secretion